MIRFAALLPVPDRHGKVRVPVGELAERLPAAGLAGVRAYLAGNLVIDAEGRAAGEIAVLIADTIADGWGVRPPVILRDGAELAAIVAGNPFPPDTPAARIMITFLRDDPDPAGARTLATYRGAEPVRLIGREIWTLYGEDVARSPFTNLPLEPLLGTPAIARTLTTVRSLARVTARASGG